MLGTANHKLLAAFVSIPLRRGDGQVPGINRHGKIRAAAFFVGGIDRGIQALFKMGADCCYQMAARAEKPSTPILWDRYANPSRESGPDLLFSAHPLTPLAILDTAQIL